MAKTHPGRAKAKSPRRPRGPQAKRRARERIAADRAAQKRAEARRRLLVPIASVAARRGDRRALVGVKLTSAPPAGGESVAPAAVVRQITTVRPRCWHGSTAAGRPRCFRRSGHPGGRWPSAENRRSCSSAKSPARSARPSAGRWPSPWPTSARGVTLAPPSPQPPTSTRTPPHSPSAPPATEARN